jgi:hypothetical protein
MPGVACETGASGESFVSTLPLFGTPRWEFFFRPFFLIDSEHFGRNCDGVGFILKALEASIG